MDEVILPLPMEVGMDGLNSWNAKVLNRPDYLPAKYLQRTKHMLLPEKSSSFHRVHRLSVISAGKGSKHLPVPNSYISRK